LDILVPIYKKYRIKKLIKKGRQWK
jgi:hypothetical protein